MSVWEGLNPPYSTIVADPPWRYNPNATDKRGTGRGRSADVRYSTLSMADIAVLPVGDLAAENAHLFMWVTNPRIYGDRYSASLDPGDVVRSWGFTYVTLITWFKDGGLGLGWHFRGQTEHVVFAVRGRVSIPPADRLGNFLVAKKARHSEKPAAFYDMVEQVSPGPYVELFARAPRLGWDSWGKGYES